MRFSLPDYDVFTISNTTLTQTGSIPGVGTINFNIAVNPMSGRVYVSNTEAINEVRFEGPGTYVTDNGFKPVGEPASVIGHLHEARISIIDGLGNVTPRHLNKHINYAAVPSPAGTKSDSLATPLEMAVSSDGLTLYVAAFGSQKVGVFDTTALENDSFVPSSADHIALSGGGPTGVVLDEVNDRLYVATRFDNSISVIDTLTKTEVAHLPTYNPEPANIVDGRPVLYDAFNTSSNGEASCSSCHVFGDFDSLAWDLGNPDDIQTVNSLPVANPIVDQGFKDFHPMKGPMTTQTLRGMNTHGAMHWRGDRSVGHFGDDPTDEELSFNNFIVAFEGLLGNDGLIPDAEMFKFTAFMLDVVLPPNPIRPLDNTLVGDALLGFNLNSKPGTDAGVLKCNQCHALAPGAGFFGANRTRSFENEPQQFKVPHLRNLYTKVGMFGMPRVDFLSAGNNGNQGPQIRGFGMLHDGSVDTVFRFLGATVFTLSPAERQQAEQFMFQFPTNYAPIVGQQTTLSSTNGGVVGSRIDLLTARAVACFELMGMPGVSECDLVVKGSIGGEARGWLGELQGGCGPAQPLLFQGDRVGDPLLTDAQLRVPGNGGRSPDLHLRAAGIGAADRARPRRGWVLRSRRARRRLRSCRCAQCSDRNRHVEAGIESEDADQGQPRQRRIEAPLVATERRPRPQLSGTAERRRSDLQRRPVRHRKGVAHRFQRILGPGPPHRLAVPALETDRERRPAPRGTRTRIGSSPTAPSGRRFGRAASSRCVCRGKEPSSSTTTWCRVFRRTRSRPCWSTRRTESAWRARLRAATTEATAGNSAASPVPRQEFAAPSDPRRWECCRRWRSLAEFQAFACEKRSSPSPPGFPSSFRFIRCRFAGTETVVTSLHHSVSSSPARGRVPGARRKPQAREVPRLRTSGARGRAPRRRNRSVVEPLR